MAQTTRVSAGSAPVMTGGDWATLVGLSVLWGGSFFFYKVLAGALPPVSVVFGRAVLSAAMLLGVLAWRGQRLALSGRRWAEAAWLALLSNAVPFLLFAWAEHHISSGLASVLNATTPIFAVLVAHLHGFERLRAGRLVGVVCGLAGTLVVVGPDSLAGASAGLAGEAACIVASISYAFGGQFARRFGDMTPLQVTAAQSSAGAVLLAPLWLTVDRPWTLAMPGLAAWAALIGMALFSTVLAYLVYFRLLARIGPTNVSLVTLLVPVSALLLGAVALGESMRPAALLGMGLIGLGLAAIDGRAVAMMARRRSGFE